VHAYSASANYRPVIEAPEVLTLLTNPSTKKRVTRRLLSLSWKISSKIMHCMRQQPIHGARMPARPMVVHAQVAKGSDWREKARPIQPGSNYPAKEFCRWIEQR